MRQEREGQSTHLIAEPVAVIHVIIDGSRKAIREKKKVNISIRHSLRYAVVNYLFDTVKYMYLDTL